MSNNPNSKQTHLACLYRHRFAGQAEYRNRVWQVLCRSFFSPRFVPPHAKVLDLGCGSGEFINNIACHEKHAMDLNPESPHHLAPEVHFTQQDCSCAWPYDNGFFEVIFSSNFFEHLPDKGALLATLREAVRCLAPGGRLITLGPNVRCLPGAYWDFWDHHVPLTERALVELYAIIGLVPEVVVPYFLPYTMSAGFKPPLPCVKLYLRLPFLWRFFGKQFLVSGVKTQSVNKVVA